MIFNLVVKLINEEVAKRLKRQAVDILIIQSSFVQSYPFLTNNMHGFNLIVSFVELLTLKLPSE
jgi:hypothetical protein